jgi:hypothetical protein
VNRKEREEKQEKERNSMAYLYINKNPKLALLSFHIHYQNSLLPTELSIALDNMELQLEIE